MKFVSLLRYRELKQRNVVSSRAQLRQMINRDGFPAGRLISPNVRVWTDQEIDEYLNNCPTEPKSTPGGFRRGHRRRKADAHPETS